jgi:glutamine synthetase
MTDLEKHVKQPGRDKLVKQVRAKINELGVEYIFFQFISVTGRVVGKGIPQIIGKELVKKDSN